MMRVDDVAAAFIDELGSMPAMKLEKLVYYAQAWSLARMGTPLFADPIEAWAQGPIIDRLFRQHRRRHMVHEWPSGDVTKLTTPARKTVNLVAAMFGKFTGDQLSDMTHRERPWINARAGLSPTARSRRHISHEDMARYYGALALPMPQAVRHARANAALEGITFDADFEATLDEMAAGRRSVDQVLAGLAAVYDRRA